MEPIVFKAYERATGVMPEPYPETLIHKDYPWMIAHLDGFIKAENKIVEVKCVGPHMIFDWGLDGDPDGVPFYVMAQCIQQAILAGVSKVDVVALLGGNDLRIYPLEIKNEAKDTILRSLVDFWDNRIVPRKQPEMTADDLELLKTLYMKCDNQKVIEVESTATALGFQDYRQLKQEIKKMEEQAKLYKAKIQDAMGDATIMMRSGDPEFTWKKNKDKTKTDWESVAKDHLESIIYKAETEQIPLLAEFGREVFQHCIEKNTKPVIGHRVFLDKMPDVRPLSMGE